MSITKWKVVWAGIVGVLTPGSTPFGKISQLALDAVNDFISAPVTAARIRTAWKALDLAARVLERIAPKCPVAWRMEYDGIVRIVRRLADAVADGRIDVAEVKGIADAFRSAYEEWNAD